MDLINLKNKAKKKLIKDIILYPLKVNEDKRGILVETLKINCPKIYHPQSRPFAQNYFSITNAGTARDENTWHYHLKQEDRFVVIDGDIVVACYDWRKKSPTFGQLNLFKMGNSNGDYGQYLLLIPKNILHGFCVVSPKPAILLNFPTKLYDKNDEGRISHQSAKAKFLNGQLFNWQTIRQQIK